MIVENETYVIYGCTTKINSINTVLSQDIPRIYGIQKNNIFFIMHFYVPISIRGKGLGTQLLVKIIEICKKNGCRRIDVDDMTDNFRKPNNIYIKNGFVYSVSNPFTPANHIKKKIFVRELDEYRRYVSYHVAYDNSNVSQICYY